MSDRPPNIVLVNCDDLGYGDVGCYGNTVHRTPRLDRMANQGVRFTDFYMGACVCSPSRAAMMTGCYPPRIGMHENEQNRWVLFPGDARGLHPDEITLATLLKRAGYATGLVGKWHLGDQPPFLPTRHGFDEYFGLPYSNDMDRKQAPLPLMEQDAIVETRPDQALLTRRYVERSIDFMRRHRDRPFFLYLAHLYVHVPLHPDPRFADAPGGKYGAEVQTIDWAMGELLDELQRLGLDENTLVIFTSDNGSNGKDGGSNGPLRGFKGDTHEGGIRVPCLMRWPGRVPAGETCSAVCTAMDFLPTFAALAGVAPPADRAIDGRDMSALMFAPASATSPHDCFVYYFMGFLQAVRDERFKLRFDTGELFDLREDVGETTDVAARRPDVVARLHALAEPIRRDIGDCYIPWGGVAGPGTRRPGHVNDPVPLRRGDDDPLVQAAYD